MPTMLPQNFFDRPTLLVARELIGKCLVRKTGKGTVRLLITETEAYDGFRDQASHARRGRTPRNAPMFGPPGHIYVYFTYGMHWMLNISTREESYPAAILIRGAGDIVGPARLTRALGLDKTLTGMKLGRRAGLWIEDTGIRVPRAQLLRTPRIGIPSSGPVWSQKPWRFLWKRR